MTPPCRFTAGRRAPGFTLIELLAALLILSLLALMSYRGLAAVLDAREHVRLETEKWRRVAAFVARFERDVLLAAPRPVRTPSGFTPAWLGRPATANLPMLEISRFAAEESQEPMRRLAYTLNDRQEIELWLWPGLDAAPDTAPARYPVLTGVSGFKLQYRSGNRTWVDIWPAGAQDPPLPQALQMRLILASGEEIVRIIALNA
jgi:general secretion pathway protein J